MSESSRAAQIYANRAKAAAAANRPAHAVTVSRAAIAFRDPKAEPELFEDVVGHGLSQGERIFALQQTGNRHTFVPVDLIAKVYLEPSPVARVETP